MPELRIGCSEFNYQHWREKFYPIGLPQRKWFGHHCAVFTTVELNVTFYRLPPVQTIDKWRDETPADFAFSLKGSRYITHLKRLLDPELPVKRFFARALRLQEKLKVVLWQFSPGFRIDLERFRTFLAVLKRSPVRNAFEFRHEGWISDSLLTERAWEGCRPYQNMDGDREECLRLFQQ